MNRGGARRERRERKFSQASRNETLKVSSRTEWRFAME